MRTCLPLFMAACLAQAFGERKNPKSGSGEERNTKPARLTPLLLAPGFLSSGAHDLSVTLDPLRGEAYVTRSSQDWRAAVLRYRRRSGAWHGPEWMAFGVPHATKYAFLAPGGRRMILDVVLSAAGEARQGVQSDLWMAERTGGGWGRAISLGPEINTPWVESFASVAANGNLYFCSNRPGGVGGFDIYRAVRTAAGFGHTECLGREINTEGNEFHPFIAPDESYLLFDAARPDGVGGNDLYISFRRPDGTWTMACPLPDVNTQAHEMRPYVSPDGKELYFASNRADAGDLSRAPTNLAAFQARLLGPGNGSQDLYRINAAVIEKARTTTFGSGKEH